MLFGEGEVVLGQQWYHCIGHCWVPIDCL